MSAPLLELRGLSKSFRRGGRARRGARRRLARSGARRDAGAGRAVRAAASRRLPASSCGLSSRTTERIRFDGLDLLAAARRGFAHAAPALPDGVPGAARRLQSARHGRPRARRSAAHPRPRRQRRTPRAPSPRCSNASASTRRLPGGAFTRFPAASASASRSPAPSPPGRRCWCSTRLCRRSTSRCVPISWRCSGICSATKISAISSSRTTLRWSASFADRIAIMDHGRIVETGAAAADHRRTAIGDRQGAGRCHAEASCTGRPPNER